MKHHLWEIYIGAQSKILYPLIRNINLSTAHNLRETLILIECDMLKQTEYASEKVIKELQKKKYNYIMNEVLQFPFWQQWFNLTRASFQDLENIDDIITMPIITKKDMQDFFSGGLVNEYTRSSACIPELTSGSTGEPFRFYLDRSNIPNRVARYRTRVTGWFGADKHYRLIRMCLKERVGFDNEGTPYKLRNRQNLKEELMGLHKYLSELPQDNAILLEISASYLRQLAEIIVENKSRTVNIAGFITFAESFYPGEDHIIKEMIQVPIRSHYTLREMSTVGQTCGQSPNDAFHINSEYYYVEVVDDSGERLENGNTGHVIITSLEGRATPFIRYDTGDIGYLVPDNCACGRTLPLLSVEGRKADVISLPDGRTVATLALFFIFNRRLAYIRQFQIIQKQPDSFLIKIIPNGHIGLPVIDGIRSDMIRILGEAVSIHIVLVSDIELSKGGKRIAFRKMF